MLVGVDGTRSGDCALAWGLREAQLRHTTVESFVVLSSRIANRSHVGFDHLDPRDAERLLVQSLQRIGGRRDGIVLRTSIGPPLSELGFEAQSTRAAVTVVGDTPGGALHDTLFRRATVALTRRAHGPLVVVPPAPRRPGRRYLAVGYDGTERSLAALRWAVSEGAIRHQPVRAIHTVNSWTPTGEIARRRQRLTDEIHRAVLDLPRANSVDVTVVEGSLTPTVAATSDLDLLVLGVSTRAHVGEVLTGTRLRAGRRSLLIPLVLVPAGRL